MNIKYITCSDPRDDVSIEELIKLLSISPKVELGIQAHPTAMSRNMPRYKWFNELINISENMNEPLNIALHVNYKWCSDFLNAEPANELMEWFYSKNKKTGQPTIKRWQFNIGNNTDKISISKTCAIINGNKNHEFILPYNEKTSECLSKIHRINAPFSVLFDSSYRIGRSPETWVKPIFPRTDHAYAGGLSPENITDELSKIKNVVPKNYTISIDAEGKLMKPGTRQFDVQRATEYIQKTLTWEQAQKNK